MLDVLDSVKEWRGFVSGLASLEIGTGPGCLTLSHRLGDTGGFAVAQASFRHELSARFSLHFQVQYQGDPCTLEVKLVSADGKDVWRANRSLSGQEHGDITLGGHDFEYAWGESGAGRPSAVGQFEFAVVSRARCAGTLTILSPQITCLAAVEPLYTAIPTPQPEAGSAGLSRMSVADLAGTGWQPLCQGDALELDLGYEELLSGVHLAFERYPVGVSLWLEVMSATTDAQFIHCLDTVTAAALWFPLETLSARRVRVRWAGGCECPPVIRFTGITLEQARTPNEFAALVARALPRGHRPASMLGEQVWWTCVSAPDAGRQALINEHGAIEFGFASPILEPSWTEAGVWHAWHDARRECTLDAALPLPVVALQWNDRHLRVIPQWVSTHHGVQIRYEWVNDSPHDLAFEFLVTLLPFQISPPSQQHGVVGGRSPIHALSREGEALIINGQYRWSASQAPHLSRLATGVQGDPRFTAWDGPEAVEDDKTGDSSAVWVWTLSLAPGQRWSVDIQVSELGHPAMTAVAWPGVEQYRAVLTSHWSSALAAIDVTLPASRQDAITCWRLCVGHILGNRQGHMINPGPRRYARSWIRDGSSMGEALLKAGRVSEVMAFVDTYADFVAEDGYVPCCIDLDGTADPLVEHDSHGQWIFLVAQVFRYSGDHGFVARHAPRTFAAAEYIIGLRRQRQTESWCQGDRRAACGLIPESVSHEGYLAQPVHSYWDDVWCLRGLMDAAMLASVCHDADRASRYRDEALDFRRAIHQSIAAVQQERGVDYVPGSVEWADLDPSASACGPAQLGFFDLYPGTSMQRTMTLFMEHWRERVVNGRAITKYSAYDVRVVRALVNLDRREEAHALLDFLLADRRPRVWQQWPEISWPDPASAGHVGDLPHTWISAEYVLAIRSCLVEETDDALILLRGVPLQWLEEGPVTVRALPTPYGPVGYRAWLDAGRLAFQWLQQPRLPIPVVLRLPGADLVAEATGESQFFSLEHFAPRVAP